jgi:tripartite-type tricarboxylate transporter receptor subunit TctC
MAEGASAKTDGYTLTVVVVEASILPHMGIMKNTVDDYRGITVTSGEPMGLVVRPDAPYKTLDELVAYAKAHPGEITMGNVGAGSAVHLAALDFEKNCGIKFMHVPYNDGTGPMIAAMVGGHLDAGFSTVVAAVPQAAAGGIRALGIMDTKRSEYWPDVPTFKEKFGIDFSHLAWAALCAPKDTPDNIINYLIDICKSAMETDEFKKQVKTLGVTPVTYYGADVDKMMRSDSDVYGPIIKELGL